MIVGCYSGSNEISNTIWLSSVLSIENVYLYCKESEEEEEEEEEEESDEDVDLPEPPSHDHKLHSKSFIYK
jgi:hypothetical protein